jgi:predicted O-linked N-acetylglucosamine transferase (SPINDLY family)
VLDTIYFGGGTTAQYAFGLGIPIVTMPGRYARGRMVYGYYSVMGITAAEAPIASDVHEYVTLAVKLANDKEYARALSEKITSQNYKLFEGDPYIDKVAPLMHDIMNQNLDAYRRNAAKV